jgi:signal transduction histidine kinase/DNA-binding response OmpR family regulator
LARRPTGNANHRQPFAVTTEIAERTQFAPPGVILVVDDTEETRYVSARWLRDAGFNVGVATTGAEALRLATGEVELVVLDVHLPDLHGFEVARRLKADPATAHLPVLHLSAKHVTPQDRVSGLEGGADGYLTQPVLPEELVAHVSALLRLSRSERAAREHNRELQAAERQALRARTIAERSFALSVALSRPGTPLTVAMAVVEHATGIFDAAGVVLVRQRPEGEDLEILGAGDMPEQIEAEWRLFPRDAPVPLAEVIRSGEPVFLESRDAWRESYPHCIPLVEAAGHHANAIVPLIVDGVVLGALGIAYATERRFTSEDYATMQGTAQLAALALERSRLLDAERASRQDAESANRAKSEFLAVMSHELRTPLNAIGGYAELMEMGIRGPITQEQRTDLERIQRSQRHLLGLINGVLNYAQVEAGHVHYELGPVAMDELLATCEALITPQARAHAVTLEYPGCAAGTQARGDGEKIRQVVLNLLSNAVKFTGAGGRVQLLCDGVVEDPRRVVVRVVDSGPGIEAQQLERIFQPFVQLDARLTRTREGTGLGLAISRDLARGMGGDLTVESIVGGGSTFTLTLPEA